MDTELVSIRQFDYCVEATIKKTLDGIESLETKSYPWVVGADGGKSTQPHRHGIFGVLV